MYNENQIREIVRRSIITYCSIAGFLRYSVSMDDVDKYMNIGPDDKVVASNKRDFERLCDFNYVDECVRYMVSTVDDELNTEYLMKMAKQFAREQDDGIFRDHEIHTKDGVIFDARVKSAQEVDNTLFKIMACGSVSIVAVEAFKYLYKTDLFTGNTIILSLLVADKILLSGGKGILYVPIEDSSDFTTLKHNYHYNKPNGERRLTEKLHTYICPIEAIDTYSQSCETNINNKEEGSSKMGAIGNMLNAAAGDSKFVEGYTPDRCWFRNLYVTSSMMGKVREAFVGSDEMSDEDVAVIIDRERFSDESITQELIIAKVDYDLEATINKFQNNRGTPLSHDDEEFIMHMVGWRDYCLMMGIISQGNSVMLIKKDASDGRRSYCITQSQ